MEDRITPGLYLELGDAAPADYARTRAPALLALPGVHRVTWWATTRPGRDELPMAIPDGTLLGVAETDDSFTAPPALPGTTARHFRRYPRPSQGILTGRPTTGLLVVWISPTTPALAQPLRDWADFVHIRTIAAAAVPGYTQITAYQNADDTDPRFMHFYEMDSDDPEATFQTMAENLRLLLGGYRTPEFQKWADWSAAGAEIIYVNTFRLLGSSDPAPV
ncbi:MAG TPA: hypothetical protein VNC61_04525 [Acidimicrobiales bacterium]|nr:hypothetical protein [Acidimicrobiales bacterium]